MINNKQIPVSTFNWGPCVIKLKIEDEFKKFMTPKMSIKRKLLINYVEDIIK